MDRIPSNHLSQNEATENSRVPREKRVGIFFSSPSCCCCMRERWIALPGDNGTSSRTTFDDQGTKHVTLVVRDSCTHSHRHRQLMGAVKSPGASKLPKQLGISSLSSPAPANLETDSSQMVPSMYCVYICCCYLQPARGQSNSTRKTNDRRSRVFFCFFQLSKLEKAL